MSQAFISYAHAQLDDALAHFLKAFLAQRGHTVFLDTDIPGGKRWAEEIEKKIRTSEFFIVLLSKDAILSDMVRQEVKFAYSLAQDQNQQLTIIPVRIDFSGELPLDLGAYLDPLQYILWTGRNDYEALGTQICDVMDRSAALPISEKQEEEEEGLQELASLTEEGGAPLPAADLRLLETGAVPLDSPFYIRREADIQLERQILGDGTTTIVKGARQSGKSSLLARAHAQAQEHQRRSFYLDFQLKRRSCLKHRLHYSCCLTKQTGCLTIRIGTPSLRPFGAGTTAGRTTPAGSASISLLLIRLNRTCGYKICISRLLMWGILSDWEI